MTYQVRFNDEVIYTSDDREAALVYATDQLTPDTFLPRVVNVITGQVFTPTTVEYRVRFRGDTSKWENMRTQSRRTFSPSLTAQLLGEAIEADTGRRVAEIRWSEKGSLQGHYVTISGRYDYPSVVIVTV